MYEDLAKRLHRMLDWELMDYDANFKFADETIAEAADAIAELSKYANTIMRLKSEGWYLQQTKHHDGYEAISTMPLPEPPKEESNHDAG